MAINIVSKESLTKVLKQFKEKIQFSNEDVLKKISVTSDNKLLYDGNPIAIDNGKSLKIAVVDTLPTSNISDSTIYLVSNGSSKENNIYTEYMYVNDKWEIIGSIDNNIDLTDYVKTTDLTNTLKNYNTKTEANTLLNRYTTKTELNTTIEKIKTDITNISNSLPQYALKDNLNDMLNANSNLIKYPLNMTNTNLPSSFKATGLTKNSIDITWKLFSNDSTFTINMDYDNYYQGYPTYNIKVQLDKDIVVKKIYIPYCTLNIKTIEAFSGDIDSTTSNGVIYDKNESIVDSSFTIDLSANEISGQTYVFNVTYGKLERPYVSGNTINRFYYTFSHIDFYIDNNSHLDYLTKTQIQELIKSSGTGSSTSSSNVNINAYDKTKTYSVNDLVIYNNCLYKCKTGITTAENFNISKWTLLLNGSSESSSLNIKQVDTLPTENILTDTIYLVPNDSDEENNSYTEYIYVNNTWEIFGTQQKVSNISIGNIEW